MTKLEQLRERLERLPRLRVTFGNADIGVPATLVAEKVIALVDELIAEERAEAPPTFADLAMK